MAAVAAAKDFNFGLSETKSLGGQEGLFRLLLENPQDYPPELLLIVLLLLIVELRLRELQTKRMEAPAQSARLEQQGKFDLDSRHILEKAFRNGTHIVEAPERADSRAEQQQSTFNFRPQTPSSQTLSGGNHFNRGAQQQRPTGSDANHANREKQQSTFNFRRAQTPLPPHHHHSFREKNFSGGTQQQSTRGRSEYRDAGTSQQQQRSHSMPTPGFSEREIQNAFDKFANSHQGKNPVEVLFDGQPILDDLNSGQWKKKYKDEALKNHPDKGGDPDKMKALNASRDCVKDLVTEFGPDRVFSYMNRYSSTHAAQSETTAPSPTPSAAS